MSFSLVVAGRKGSGKSSLIQNEILPLLPRPVYIFDSMREYSGTVFGSVRECAELLKSSPEKLESLVALFYLKPTKKDLQDGQLSMIDAVFELGDMTGGSCIIEEAWHYSTPYSQPYPFKRALLSGRHFAQGDGFSTVFVSQRIANLHRDTSSQADSIVTFRQTEPRDLEYLARREGSAEIVRELEKYHFTIFGELPEELESLYKNKFYTTNDRTS